MIERIVYVSRAAPGIGLPQAYDIIRTAHNRNRQHHLTGALILIDGHFLQVLEGDRWRLRERFARITADPRHTQLQVRMQGMVAQPTFAGEWMALRHGDAIPAELRAAHGYLPGMPADRMDGPALVAFAQAACGTALPA